MSHQQKIQYKQILKAIKAAKRIAVFRHELPDFDALGTQWGLVTWLRDNFIEKEIRIVGKDHVSFTPRLYPEMEVVEDEWFETPFLAIVVDTGNRKRIDDKRFEKAEKMIKFDHHPNVEPYGEWMVVQEEASSCAEVVYDFLHFAKKYPLSSLAAKYLFSAIVGDSGRFMYPSTSAHTFQIASELLQTGFHPQEDVYYKMYEKTVHDLEITKFVLNHAVISETGVAYYVLKDSDLKQLKITAERGKENLSQLANIKGIEIWASVTEDASIQEYRVSIRSKRIAINDIAAQYRGGGHACASGARVNSMEELETLMEALNQRVRETN